MAQDLESRCGLLYFQPYVFIRNATDHHPQPEMQAMVPDNPCKAACSPRAAPAT